MKRNQLEKIFLGLGVVFTLYIVVSIFWYGASDERAGIITDRTLENQKSQVEVSQFTQMKLNRGKKIWQIQAKNGQYLTEEKKTLLQNAEIKLARRDGSEVTILSDTAKLILNGDDLERADLEGNVVVLFESGLRAETVFATYDAKLEQVVSPGKVRVLSEGFQTIGNRGEIDVQKSIVDFSGEVQSHFESGKSKNIIPKI
jgi:LPS export ABC transporter protein LptC